MAYNLKEYILFRTEENRELFNGEVDTNFKMVSNPWVENRSYEEGNIVYHAVIIGETCDIDAILQENATDNVDGNDISALLLESAQPTEFGCDIGAILLESASILDTNPTGENGIQQLAWWRAKKRTTRGVFLLDEWDLVGGIGGGDLNVRGADGFGRILVNYDGPTGPFQTANNVLLRSPNPDATLNFVAGDGVQIQHDVVSNSIKFINITAGGEINNGTNLGTGESVYGGMSGLDLTFLGFGATNISTNTVLSVSTNLITKNIEYNFNSSQITLGELSNGAPTADELSDITYPSGLPTNGDILQWNSSSASFLPISVVSLGLNNIFTANGTTTDTSRTLTLNASTSANFSIKGSDGGIRIDNTALGYNRFKIGSDINTSPSNFLEIFPDDSTDVQIVIQNQTPDKTVVSIGHIEKDYFFGYHEGSETFGIISGQFDSGFTTIQGSGIDYLSVGIGGSIYTPQLGDFNPSPLGNEHYIPFVENSKLGLDAQGRQRTESGLSWTFDGTDGTSSTAKQFSINYGNEPLRNVAGIKAGLWVQNVPDVDSGVNDYGIYAKCTQTIAGTSESAIAIATELNEDGGGFAFVNLSSYIDISPRSILTGVDSLLFGPTAADIAVNIVARNSMSVSIPQIGVSSYWGTGSTSSSKIGIFSDIINTYSSTIQIDENGESWSGLFRGCVAIKNGSLVLDVSATNPSCNIAPTGEIPYEERSLWINESNGHLYRGPVDIETTRFKSILASGNFSVKNGSSFPSDDTEAPGVSSFAIGGNFDSGDSINEPPRWTAIDWSNAGIVTIGQVTDAISSIDSDHITAGIVLPFDLVTGDTIKLNFTSRVNRTVHGINILQLTPAIMSIKVDDYLLVTGNETEVRMLQLDNFTTVKQNDPVDIFSGSVEVTISPTQELSAGDSLLIGFKMANFNISSVDIMSMSWSLSIEH